MCAELHLQLQLEDVNVEGESYILEQVIRRTSQAGDGTYKVDWNDVMCNV